MTVYRLLLTGAAQVVQVARSAAQTRLTGAEDCNNMAVLQGAPGYSILVDSSGTIAAVDTDDVIHGLIREGDVIERTLDITGKAVIPGLVDAHTHAVFAGDRVHEFAMKLAGASYMEVHQAGGGIHYTVDHVRKASEEELLALLLPRLAAMLRAGTTLAEVKSGYGLDTAAELKMLRVIERAKSLQPVELSATFCGAHAIPRGSTAEAATDDVIAHQLPALKAAVERGDMKVENIDVFTEKNCFTVEQTRRILQAGAEQGLAGNFHAEELSCQHSAEMGAQLGVRAMSHLEEVSDAGVAAMATSGTLAVLLPTTAYILRLQPPPARQLIQSGVAVALGSDFNPNAPCLSMPLVMHLACVNLRMSLPEALTAATLHAAESLGRGATHGAVTPGRVADLVILDTPRWEHLVYQLGGHRDVISHVIKRGHVVHTST